MRSCKFIFSCLNNKTSYLVHEECHDPGQYGCIAGCKKWPFPASGFLPDGSKGRNTWEIKQRKEHVGKSYERSNIRLLGDTFGKCIVVQISVIRIENSQSTYNKFFGSDTGKKSDSHFPVET